jgi:exodeoxyribonuclease VII large subunit
MQKRSELDFGEMVLSVADLSSLIEQSLSLIPVNLQVKGEVQKVRIFKDFWIFFDLVDEERALSCMCSLKDSEGQILTEGEKVLLSVSVGLGKRSDIRLRVSSAQNLDQVGDRAKNLEELKLKLRAEGLFLDSRKRPLVDFPKGIAVITSESSSAWQDFKKIARNRWPAAKLKLFSVSVQGQYAEGEIKEAFKKIEAGKSNFGNFDVVALIRGGGSRDDLAAFDLEGVVRAVAECSVPVVVGVGHEDDFSIADLVADVRASTPSNAAELILPDRAELKLKLEQRAHDLQAAKKRRLDGLSSDLKRMAELLESVKLNYLQRLRSNLSLKKESLKKYDLAARFKAGWAFIEVGGNPLKSYKDAAVGDIIKVNLKDGTLESKIIEKYGK